jgi:hypothetical protein
VCVFTFTVVVVVHTILHAITVVRPVVSTVAVLGRFCLPRNDGSRVKTVTKGSPFAGVCCRTVAQEYDGLVTCLNEGLFQ